MIKFKDYLNFSPIFHSEISSSYMLYEILKSDKEIANKFISELLEKPVDKELKIHREKKLSTGSIDLFIETRISGRDSKILIECKVHDYLSATPNQITRYYESALDQFPDNDIYFIYLTQFTKENISGFPELSRPPTLDEFDRATKSVKQHERLFHKNWISAHEIICNFSDKLNDELNHIRMIHMEWIKAQCIKDKEEQSFKTGDRDLSSYLPDIEFQIPERLSFGQEKSANRRKIWEINIKTCSRDELKKVVEVVEDLARSNALDPHAVHITPEATENAMQSFINFLIEDSEWDMATFYINIFALADKLTNLKMNGSGVNAFSILGKVKGKGQISLCTLRIKNKHTIEFGLLR